MWTSNDGSCWGRNCHKINWRFQRVKFLHIFLAMILNCLAVLLLPQSLKRLCVRMGIQLIKTIIISQTQHILGNQLYRANTVKKYVKLTKAGFKAYNSEESFFHVLYMFLYIMSSPLSFQKSTNYGWGQIDEPFLQQSLHHLTGVYSSMFLRPYAVPHYHNSWRQIYNDVRRPTS